MLTQVKTVDTIEMGQTQSGTPKYKITWTDGKFDTVLNEDMLATLREAEQSGSPVTITKEKKGDYWNITGVTLGAAKATAAKTGNSRPASGGGRPSAATEPARERSMALAYAKDVMVARIRSGEEFTLAMFAGQFKMADMYRAYIDEGKTPDATPKPVTKPSEPPPEDIPF